MIKFNFQSFENIAMKRLSIVILLLLASSQIVFAAGSASSTKEIEATYAEDKKICAEETDSGARMQCLRDAKSEYTKGLAAAKKGQTTGRMTSSSEADCMDCGKVLEVNVAERKGEGGALGLIGGGVVGALLGNQVGSGRGKTLATVAGAAGGAYAGKKVEENVKTSSIWAVRVRFDSGQERVYEFNQEPQFSAGDLVKKSGESISRR
jgi:outer membrane lipoprotein SlyB